jgi:endoglucanase
MKRLTEVASALLLFGRALAAVQCKGTFTPIAGDEWVKQVNPGWNLGNTLDAVPTEGAWNNPPVRPATFDLVKKAGFKSVRLPGRSPQHNFRQTR